MQWDDLRHFLALARARTLTGAAATLGVDATTIGRRVERLALTLNTSLFDVTPSGHILSPSGEALLRHAEEMERSSLAASNALTGERTRLAGTVRISLSAGFASWVVAPRLPDFRERHPDIRLETVSYTHLRAHETM
jgi:DNA-binding transcriptional LysR family regulator